MTHWHGLPNDWREYMKLDVNHTIPWHWRVTRNVCSSNVTTKEVCSSNSRKLGAFAAVNVAVLIAVPIVGRRDVVSKLTFGCLGGAQSKYWFISAIIVVALQLLSNFFNAFMISRTRGFSNVSIGSLMLLWCNRPRVAWLSVFLLRFRAQEAMYFSTAASSLLAELILQFIGSYYMGLVANFGTKHKLYRSKTHTAAQRGRYVQMMYAGALLWLLFFVVALWAVAWSALNVNRVISEVGREVVQVKLRNMGKQRTANKFAEQARKFNQKASTRQKKILDRMKEVAGAEASMRLNGIREDLSIDHEAGQLRAEHQSWSGLVESCGALASSWVAVKDEMLRIPEEEKAQNRSRKTQLGEKDIISVRNKLVRIDTKLGKLTQSEDDIARAGTLRNERFSLERRLRIYTDRRKEELNAHLEDAYARRDNGRTWEQALFEAGAQISNPEMAMTWAALREEWQELEKGWERIAQSWRDEIDLLARMSETTRSRDRELQGRYVLQTLRDKETASKMSSIPLIAAGGMLMCWIAQWLFWAGFINLASDQYCPPKLNYIIIVWIGFSITGKSDQALQEYIPLANLGNADLCFVRVGAGIGACL